MPDASIRVLNSLPVWLPRTSPWLFNQVKLMPPTIVSRVVAERRGAENRFTLGLEDYFEDLPRLTRLRQLASARVRFKQLEFFHSVAGRFRPQVLHSHWGDHGWRDVPVARRCGARHIVTYYGKDVGFLPQTRPKWRKRYLELFASCELILCEGPFMASCIVNLGCPPSKVRVHRLGAPLEAIEYRTRQREPGEPLRILMAASFREKKGLSYALTAVGLARPRIGPVAITIIGDASDDPRSAPEKERILGAIRDHRLQDDVVLMGYQPYSVLIEQAYKHHIFMSPSVTAADGDTEGGAPVTLIDMAATGILILSSTHCDIPQVIVHGETGLLAPERDASALASNLVWFAEHSERWGAFSRAGRAHVDQNFSASIQAQRLSEIYVDLALGRLSEPN